MKVRIPINIRAKSQVDWSTHNENLGRGPTKPLPPSSPLRLYVLKGLRLERLKYNVSLTKSDAEMNKFAMSRTGTRNRMKINCSQAKHQW